MLGYKFSIIQSKPERNIKWTQILDQGLTRVLKPNIQTQIKARVGPGLAGTMSNPVHKGGLHKIIHNFKIHIISKKKKKNPQNSYDHLTQISYDWMCGHLSASLNCEEDINLTLICNKIYKSLQFPFPTPNYWMLKHELIEFRWQQVKKGTHLEVKP